MHVGATWGLASLEQDSAPSGSSATALHLIYDQPATHVESAKKQGFAVLFQIDRKSKHSAAHLAKSFKYRGLVSARADSEVTFEAVFSTEKDAAQVASLAVGGFSTGPYRLVELTGKTATLSRKSKHPIGKIVLQEITTQDEWRLFLGKRLDIIPRASVLYRHRFAGIPGVKIVDYAPHHEMSLIFNTDRPILSDVENRRTIASLIDRQALARVVSGEDNHVVPVDFRESPMSLSGGDVSFELVYLERDVDVRRSAEVIRFQLGEQGIEIKLRPVDIAELKQIGIDRSFELTILPIPMGHRGHTRFLSSSHGESTNITGFANDDYDIAFAVGNAATMKSILLREVPATPLYIERYFAAMQSDLCLDEEPNPSSWRWLAAIYPCSRERRK